MKFKYKRFLLQWNPFRLLIDWMRAFRIRRYENVSLYTLVRTVGRKFGKDDVFSKANSVSFNFVLAVFPAVIFLFTLIPYVGHFIPEVNRESILEFLSHILPESMFVVISETVNDIISNTRGGLLTFGFIFSMWLSTNGMMALMRAFNSIYKTNESRGIIKMRFIATALTLMIVVVLIVAIVLLVIGQFILENAMTTLAEYEWLAVNDYAYYLILMLRFIVIFVAFFLAIATIYYFGPAIHYNWRFFSIGSLLATLLCLGASYGFSYYVTNFGTYNKLYGSLGVMIAIMIWIQLITTIMMIGYEINASIHQAIRTQIMLKAKHEWKS